MRLVRLAAPTPLLVLGAVLTSAFVGAAPMPAAAAGLNVRAVAVATGSLIRPYDGEDVVMQVGQQVTLRLRACESCGYRWVFRQRPDASVVAYRGRSSITTTCAGCVGGYASEDFRFTAMSLGQTAVRFAYVRPSGTVAQLRTVTLAVLRHPRSRTQSSVHVVRAGDTLFRIARAALGADGTPPRVAYLAGRLYRDNRAVIGPDPDFILPGQVLLVDLTALPACGTTALPAPCRR